MHDEQIKRSFFGGVCAVLWGCDPGVAPWGCDPGVVPPGLLPGVALRYTPGCVLAPLQGAGGGDDWMLWGGCGVVIPRLCRGV